MTILPTPKVVLFDWDNTLVDTWPLIHESYNATFAALGMPLWKIEQTKAWARQSMRDGFPRLFGDRWTEARDVYYNHYKQYHLELLTPLAGAYDLLKTLVDAGVYVGIVSNKGGTILREEADKLGWTPLFGRLVGAMDAAHDKPARDAVDLALEQAPIQAGPEVWFVGDTDIDLECAHNAGCTPVLLGDASQAKTWPAALHLHGCEALRDVVSRLFKPSVDEAQDESAWIVQKNKIA